VPDLGGCLGAETPVVQHNIELVFYYKLLRYLISRRSCQSRAKGVANEAIALGCNISKGGNYLNSYVCSIGVLNIIALRQ